LIGETLRILYADEQGGPYEALMAEVEENMKGNDQMN